MALFVSTIKFTHHGATNVRQTCQRAEEFKKSAKAMGCKVTDIYWTPGPFDGLIVFDAPDEETATAAMLHLASQGNVRTETARAYKSADMKKILDAMPKVGNG